MASIIIRREAAGDTRVVEEIHRRAFWNVNAPGCDEHYLAHVLRGHADFIPELDCVAELDGRVVANVMYSKSRLVDAGGNEREILTFGPIAVEPEYQRRGIGKKLLRATFEKAADMGYRAIVIFGDPGNYVSSGFRSAMRYNVCLPGDVFPMALLVKELEAGFFDGRRYYFHESPAFEISAEEAAAFDRDFPHMEKKVLPSQEVFYIHSHSTMR